MRFDDRVQKREEIDKKKKKMHDWCVRRLRFGAVMGLALFVSVAPSVCLVWIMWLTNKEVKTHSYRKKKKVGPISEINYGYMQARARCGRATFAMV